MVSTSYIPSDDVDVRFVLDQTRLVRFLCC